MKRNSFILRTAYPNHAFKDVMSLKACDVVPRFAANGILNLLEAISVIIVITVCSPIAFLFGRRFAFFQDDAPSVLFTPIVPFQVRGRSIWPIVPITLALFAWNYNAPNVIVRDALWTCIVLLAVNRLPVVARWPRSVVRTLNLTRHFARLGALIRKHFCPTFAITD